MKQNFCKCLLGFISLIFLTTFFNISYASITPTFHKIIFFGDSLSDNGNLYYVDFGYLPKSPPYYEGRFSNGIVWSERAAEYYQTQYGMDASTYAYGGETSVMHNPMHGFLPYSLTASLDSYLLHTAFHDRSETLFIIWIGANDYLPGVDNVDELTTKVVDNIKATVESLIYHGGTNFLVVNLPDLSKTPYGRTSDMGPMLNSATNMHNQKLAAVITDLQQGYQGINIHLFDANKLFDDFVSNTSLYNSKYQVNITNTTDACWPGGYTLKDKLAAVSKNDIAKKLQAHINANPQLAAANEASGQNLNVSGFSDFIRATPDLMEAYNVGESADADLKPCGNPDSYLFWDHVHPTATMHMMISKTLIDYINSNYQPT